MNRSKFLLILLVVLVSDISKAQLLYYQDSFNGGITVGGWSPGVSATSGNGDFILYIEPGSTIHAAFLVGACLGPATAGTVTLNGTPFAFNAGTEVTGGFTTVYSSPSAVHVIDVTTDLDPNVVNYAITYTNDGSLYAFQDFQLVVFYENAGLPQVTGALFLNTDNLDLSNHTWNLNVANPIATAADVGLSFFNSYQCDMFADSEQIWVNGTQLGNVGGNDYNSSMCGGTLGNCYYQSGTLTGLGDDVADQAVNGGDALSLANALIPDASTSASVEFIHQSGGFDNHQWSLVLMYGTDCVAPIVDFSATPACLGEDVVFTDLSGNDVTSWSWDFDDGNFSISESPMHLFASTGTYNVSLTVVGAGGCSASTNVNVTVFDFPAIVINDDFDCVNNEMTLTAIGAISYLWQNGQPGSSITVPANDGDTYSVTGFISASCDGIASFTLDVPDPLSVEVSATNATCGLSDGQVSALVNGGTVPYDYEWTGVVSNLASQNVAAGNYFVQITDANDCIVISDVIVVNQNGEPIVSVIQDANVCPGEMVWLIAIGAETYLWNTGELTDSILVEAVAMEQYDVIGTSGACQDQASIDLVVFALPALEVTPVLLCEFGDTQELTAEADFDVSWTPNTFLSCDLCLNPQVTPTEDIIYEVTVTDPITGCSSSDSAYVYIITDYTIYAPNAMTCDDDGINELFKIYGSAITYPHLIILNRWGVKIFESTDPEVFWNGDSGGGFYAQNGVYIWQLEYSTDQGRQTARGIVTLLR